MTATVQSPVETALKPSAQKRAVARNPAGPMGFGNGPVIAASVMVGGAALFAGWGLMQLATSDGGFVQALRGNHAPVEAPGNFGEKTDEDGSAQQPSKDGTGKHDERGASQGPAPSRADEDKLNRSGAPAAEKPTSKAKPYTIEPGDTLPAISGTTGVPFGILVESNKIRKQASLLIPQV